ncbi:GNAT family N-acetyltransferase [Fredinandcohnia humi]
MFSLQIKKITKDNWEDVFTISVHEEQKTFVPSTVESLAFAYLKPWDEALDPYAIYKENEIIGAFYLSYTPNSENNYWLGGFQIDKRFQGQGLGKAALHRVIDFIYEKHPNCKQILLTVEKENHQAIRLYEGAGFTTQNKENQYNEAIFKLAK